ncbi:5-formyltetrahydrofolate cyclo-ligase [Drosophila rhopaloa]|uniref:5-formyltetrahydrofolate cyclo-ligase n=1 Tax=Drosophila rhopaloa TaxID=1041015 RepID=A0A6P4FSQ2_DRORH|nr:5-formyltetrahydrofolate cyclo-ligase [Drosophila rhopaloa]
MPALERQMGTVLTGSHERAVQDPPAGMATFQNTLKIALRKRMKDALKSLDSESIVRQSRAVTAKVLQSESFRQSTRVSIYLSTTSELDTTELLCEMFRLEKMVFVPTYEGTKMKMVRLRGMDEYESLPLTKWNIKQPDFKEAREDAMTNGHGIDLFIVPGVAFTRTGARMGHGMGYYDKFLKQHADKYPHKKISLMALALNEQIISNEELPMESHDVRLHSVITEN